MNILLLCLNLHVQRYYTEPVLCTTETRGIKIKGERSVVSFRHVYFPFRSLFLVRSDQARPVL